MSYTRPSAASADASWSGASAYTRPSASAADATFPTDAISGTAAVTLDLTADAAGAHGVSGSAAVTLDLAADAAGSYTSNAVVGTADAALDLTADAAGAHGVSGSAAATLDLAADGSAGHGVAGPESASLDISAQAYGAHGVAGAGVCTLTCDAAATGTVFRYEVSGQVQQGVVLLNRRVRVYSRSTGALISEGDTVTGHFKLHAGFTDDEVYTLPIDLDSGATDFTPPVANRVVPVLAQDA